ncbi:ABC transporter permease/M1 family aminopeptidase [Vulgatibacter sp.]|uniref:ABC transporter permease/M1 family aminopeptidase n=1 Tax=Vulgatibacter sp. TaxID=1971226 RepID=UPI00356A5FE3
MRALSPIAAFEVRYQLRQPLFWSIFAIFFLLSFGVIALEQIKVGAGGNVLKNSPFAIAQLHLVFTLFFMFVTTAFVANVALRDDETGFGPILRATPIAKAAYLYGRFAGAFAMAALCFLAIPFGVLLGTAMPWVDPQVVGPNSLAAYAYAYLFLALPGLFVTSAAFFLLATSTRSPTATWIGVVAFFVVYLAANVLLDEPGYETIVALAEPFGLSAFNETTRYWTAADRNTQLAGTAGLLLYNRLIWIGVSVVLLALAHPLFRFGERKRKAKPSTDEPAAPPPQRPLPAPRFGPRTITLQLAAQVRFETRQVLRSRGMIVLLELGVVNAVIALANVSELFDVDLHPVTRVMIETLEGSFGLFPLIIAAFYAGELVWRERDHRIHEIVDATPLPDWAFLVPKTIALALVLLAMLGVSAVAAIGVQAWQGYTHFELGKYLGWYILPGAIEWTLLAVLAVFLQVIAPSKPMGWGLMLLYLVATMVLSNLGFEHGLYRYGGGPTVPLSDMNGTGDFAAAANWFRAYWSAFALLLLVAGHLLWRRGTNRQLRTQLRSRFRPTTAALSVFALLLLAGIGGFVLLNTHVWNDYATAEENDERLAAMEKELLAYEKVPQPAITDVKLDLDLHPHEPRLVTTGSYRLENHTAAPLAEVHIAHADGLEVAHLAIEGARLEKEYERFDYSIYRFEPALEPGQARTLSFRTVLAQKGFKHRGNTTRLVDNGTFVNNAEFAPLLGFHRSGLLKDRAKRRKYGLPEELRPARLEDESARAHNYVHVDWVNAEITVTTDADQTPIAPGYRVSDESRDGRRTARFVTEAPILHFFSVQSAAYEVEHAEHEGVELAVYYDGQHRYNVDRMIEAMKASLATYRDVFGPYQFRYARVVEFPAYAMYAQAFAGTMPYAEGLGFIARFEDEEAIDYVTYVTAHEVAHQWWAHQIIGADVQGATALSETLAQYSALLVMERLYGPHQIRRFLKYELDRYLRSRGSEAVEELPLVRVENQPYIHYQKGSLVMYLLKERIGEEAVNRALRTILERHRFQAAPFPTAQHLVDLLRAEAGPEHDQLITDLFERITLYDLRVEEAKVAARGDGRFDVTLQVHARKLYADGKGVETEAALGEGESFDVGLFLEKPGKAGFGDDDVLHLARLPLREGAQEVTLTVERRPAFAGVDPYNKQIDRNSDDNLVAVAD